MLNNEPDYTLCALDDLEAIVYRIDREKFPERFAKLQNEIKKRKSNLPQSETNFFSSNNSQFPSVIKRYIAFSIDCLLIQTVILVCQIIPIPMYLSFLISLAVSLAYFTYFDIQSASPGKKLLGIKIINIQGNKMTFLQALFRANIYTLPIFGLSLMQVGEIKRYPLIVFAIALVYIFGITLFPILHLQKRSLLDVLSKTFVVNKDTTHVEKSVKGLSRFATISLVFTFGILLLGIDKINSLVFDNPEYAHIISEINLSTKELQARVDFDVTQLAVSLSSNKVITFTCFVSSEVFNNTEKLNSIMNEVTSVLKKNLKSTQVYKINFNFKSERLILSYTKSF